jgi:hypothetical protein
MAFIDALMPGNRLPGEFIAAAAGVLTREVLGLILTLAQRFAEETSLKPDTLSYYRAEFRNVM